MISEVTMEEQLRTYSIPCDRCKGRIFCICASLYAAGFCVECKTFPLEEPTCVCTKCNGRYECFCELDALLGYRYGTRWLRRFPE